MLLNHKALKREVYSITYLCISFGDILRQLLQTNRRLSAGVCEHCPSLEAAWRLSAGVYTVNYMRQIDSYLQGCVLCQLHEPGWRMSEGCV